MMQHIFLVEIGTEELPPKSLRSLAENFAAQISSELYTKNINHGEVKWFASPRRLAVKITNINSVQNDNEIEIRGPSITQAFDINGNPTKAAESWARRCGIKINQAESIVIKKEKFLNYRTLIKGKPVHTLLCGIVNRVLGRLSFSSTTKMIYWNTNQFIRPIHTVTILLDNTVITGNVLGINTNRIILGHRFMGEQKIIINHADDYPRVLLDRGKVMADYMQRKEKIRKDVETAAKKINGIADISEKLLEEVTSLVEWPVVLTACFEKTFLSVPSEALVNTMKKNQKYFPIYSFTGELLPYFIFVANIESKDPQHIITGNEKVIRPRLFDAKFFFHKDLKQRLEDRLPHLDTIMFQKKLGTLRDKSERVKELSAWIAGQIGANVNHATRAGLLSKCDLTTNMVLEFIDTQGVMGMYYARHDGEPEAVALAQKEQYLPRFSGDVLPSTLVSCSVAIADKIDTLTGIFGIGLYPKGDRDPFALRRAAIGILRIIVEKKLIIDLQTLAEKTVQLYGKKLTNYYVVNNVVDFILGRFDTWYQEQGYNIDIIQAVKACRPTCPIDFDARIRAVSYFCTMVEYASLAAANKRVSNILAKYHEPIKENLKISLLKEPAEITLATNMIKLRERLQPLFIEGRYQEALFELTSLKEPIDAFFDSVMVMVDEPIIRINRITLLSQLRNLFLQIADFSLLQ